MSSTFSYQLIGEEYYFGNCDEDFGENIRKHIKSLSNSALITKEDTDKFTKQIDSLERLAKNTYGSKYQRIYESTATGLSAQECNKVLSSEFLQYLNEDKKNKPITKLSN